VTHSIRTQHKTQRSLRLHGPRDLRVDEIPMAEAPGPGQVLVRITAVGICGSDLHTYLDGHIGETTVESPVVLGHEFGGMVESVGADAVDGMGRLLRKGTRVAVDPARSCGHCELCRTGSPNLCTNLEFAGLYPFDGALQEFMTIPSSCCFPVPEVIDDPATAMLEPLGIAIHAIRLAHIDPGDTVAIVGAGTIGLCCVQVARLAGATSVFSTDRFDWRLEVAKRFGATPIDITDSDPAVAIMEATSGRGVDVALECAWSSDEAVAQAVDVLRPGGRLVIVGISNNDRLVFNHSAVRRRGLTIAICRRMKHTYPRAIDLVTRARVDVATPVTDHVGLHQAASAFEDAATYRRGIIKAMVQPGSA
jgi:L-iditol 2-dehydrogenase